MTTASAWASAFCGPTDLEAIRALQKSVAAGKDRFLFEMATGTGKTLLSAAVIKLFLRTLNARRVLVPRRPPRTGDPGPGAGLRALLSKDYTSRIYKRSRDDWRKADIVVSTVQTLLAGNRYRRVFRPDDFDLVISDEAHRSIGGSSRAVFEYFGGCKLGLTATPKDYLKNIDPGRTREKRSPRARAAHAPRQLPHLRLRDLGSPPSATRSWRGSATATSSAPPWRTPRTTITAQLLCRGGFLSTCRERRRTTRSRAFFKQSDFEKQFFSRPDQPALLQDSPQKTLSRPHQRRDRQVHHLLRQPEPRGEDGADSQRDWPDRDVPGQVSVPTSPSRSRSAVADAQQMTINFTNNKLLGHCKLPATVQDLQGPRLCHRGMMTTGYDCPTC